MLTPGRKQQVSTGRPRAAADGPRGNGPLRYRSGRYWCARYWCARLRRIRHRSAAKRLRAAWVASALVLLLQTGCTQEMYDQPRKEYLEGSRFFSDGMSARHPVEHTVAREELWAGHPFFTGLEDGQPVQRIPSDPRPAAPLRDPRATLQRGRDLYDAFCSHCHGRAGYGQGMIVRHGFYQPPSLHEARLRDEMPPGEYFRVITAGFRNMPAQGSRLAAADRWAIVAYVQVLQRSQHLKLADAPQDIRRKFPSEESREASP